MALQKGRSGSSELGARHVSDGDDPFAVPSSIILHSVWVRQLWRKARRGDLSSTIADNPVLTSLGAGRLS
jgi:hypothetical protein